MSAMARLLVEIETSRTYDYISQYLLQRYDVDGVERHVCPADGEPLGEEEILVVEANLRLFLRPDASVLTLLDQRRFLNRVGIRAAVRRLLEEGKR